MLTGLKRPERKVASPRARDNGTEFRDRRLDARGGDLEVFVIIRGHEPEQIGSVVQAIGIPRRPVIRVRDVGRDLGLELVHVEFQPPRASL